MLRRSTAAAVAIVLLLLATSCGADPGTTAGDTTTTAATVAIGAGLTGPSGLVATVAATGLEHVAALTTDASGRVWASTAAAADDGTDAVFLLPTDGSAPVAAITGLHTPLGLQWVDDTLLVASKDVVEAYSGFDGTAFAEHHVALTLPDGVGESNGMARSADGRIVLGISAPCDHCTPTSPYSASRPPVFTSTESTKSKLRFLRSWPALRPVTLRPSMMYWFSAPVDPKTAGPTASWVAPGARRVTS
jgi:hypothetical protein